MPGWRWTALLALLLCCCTSLGRADVEASALALFLTSRWDFLDLPSYQWQVELESFLSKGKIILEWLEQHSSSQAFTVPEPDCPWCRAELKCHFKMYAMVTSFLQNHRELLTQHRRLKSGSATKVTHNLVSGYLHILLHLHHGRSFAALRQSVALAAQLGWAWNGRHLTALGHGHEPCWDQIALLRVMMHDKATTDDFLAYRLNFGSLEEDWQEYLNQFFKQSKEHSLPWTVEGNLQVVENEADNVTPLSTSVQWALPKLWFEISEYIDRPEEPVWQHAEARAFIAAGYAWYPSLLALHKDAEFGVRLWVPPRGSYTPASPEECRVWVDEPLLFNISFSVVHASGGPPWTSSWLCSWPQGFDELLVCASPHTMPLWRMLTGDLPGYVLYKELLLSITVEMQSHCEKGSEDHSDGGSGGSEGGWAGDCDEQDLMAMGSLVDTKGMLSTPIIRWGFLHGHPGLRGLHGFESRRLLGSGALAVERQLATIAAQRLAGTPWVDASLYSNDQAEAVLAQGGLLMPHSGGMCSSSMGQGGSGVAEDEFCEAMTSYWEEDELAEPGSHLANGLAALALLLVPLAGWQAVRLYRRRQDRLRAEAKRSQQARQPVHPHSHRHQVHQKHQPGGRRKAQGRAGANGTAWLPPRPVSAVSTAARKQQADASMPPSSPPAASKQLLGAATRSPTESSGGGRGAPGLDPATLPPVTSAAVTPKRRRRAKGGASPTPPPSPATPEETAASAAAAASVQASSPWEDESEPAKGGSPEAAAPEAEAAPQLEHVSAMPCTAETSSSAAGAPGSEAAGTAAGAEAAVAAATAMLASAMTAAEAQAELPPELHPFASARDILAVMPPLEVGAVLPSGASQQAAAAAAASPSVLERQPLPGEPLSAAGGSWSAAPTGRQQAIPAVFMPPLYTVPAPALDPAAVSSVEDGTAAANDSSECIICWEAWREVVLVPCGHLGMCRRCADDLLAQAEPLCPLCRSSVSFAQAFFTA